MQKRFLAVLLVVTMGLALTACDSNSKKIGVINEEKVYAESNAAKAAVKHLDSFSAALQPELAKLQAKIDRSPENKNLQQETEKRFYDMQQQFGAEQQRVVNKVNNLYTSAREKCRKDAGMSLILSSEMTLSYDSTVDITEKVIAEMDKTTIDFSDSETKAEDATATSKNATGVKAGNATNMKVGNATDSQKDVTDTKKTSTTNKK